MKRAIVWFRQDLRLHDNEALTDALHKAQEVMPVYIFDERTFKGTTREYGFPKTYRFRAKFILEAVADVRAQLRARGSELLVRVGKPEVILCELARKHKASWVFCNRERTYEEVAVQDALEQKLWNIGVEMMYVRGKLLYHTQDLPFPVSQTPDTFTHFRKEVEKIVSVRPPLPAPAATDFQPLTWKEDAGDLPTPSDFGWENVAADPRAVLPFVGGETTGLQRLQYYLYDTHLIKSYKETRNGLIGGDYSSKLSAWLAQGCVSPKRIYEALQHYEQTFGGNDSTYWLYFELLWRDFFRLMAKKYDTAIFRRGGIQRTPSVKLSDNWEAFEKWRSGNTGDAFVDANMRELNATGFMSNRGRQNVASYLVHDLHVNWQLGAEYFESMLIDYDVASNWGNWNYIAGVGNDPRENRHFNTQTQAKTYDPHGDYVRLWSVAQN